MVDKYKTNNYGYYETYTFEEFVAEGYPEGIPIGLFKIF